MENLTDHILVALRKIIRATDLHSRRLERETGLTAPQLILLRDIQQNHNSSVSDIGRRIHLSQATVTSILNRLEGNGLVKRTRSTRDKRRMDVSLTGKGTRLIQNAPQPLQDEFVARLNSLETWEQLSIVASLERIAAMMDAEELDAAALLATGEDVQ